LITPLFETQFTVWCSFDSHPGTAHDHYIALENRESNLICIGKCLREPDRTEINCRGAGTDYDNSWAKALNIRAKKYLCRVGSTLVEARIQFGSCALLLRRSQTLP
jgi:hypothetical protein